MNRAPFQNNRTHHRPHDPEMRRLDKNQVDRISRAVYSFYMEDRPAPDKVIVYKPSIGGHGDNMYQATVRVETYFIAHSPKHHKVTIKFRLNKAGKVDSSTLQYL